ncbi:MAG TPA: transporter [Gemmatales bacterium]|nr:transporter [Gemmatales bacterium]
MVRSFSIIAWVTALTLLSTHEAKGQIPVQPWPAAAATTPGTPIWSEPRGDQSPMAFPVECGRPPRTLLKWLVGGPEPEDRDEDTIAFQADRPDFTEASRTVGRGRIQLESGYTYSRDRQGGVTFRAHSFPEALFRIGMFADWFELRIAQNFLSVSAADNFGSFRASGAEDLYLGVKLWLVEQRGILPEAALQIEGTVPTGADAFTENRIQPGLNLLYGWDIIEDVWTAGGSLLMRRAVDGFGHSFMNLGASFTFGFSHTERLGSYIEWFVIAPSGALPPDLGAQHYLNGGFTYKITEDFQLDIRAGVGLSERSEDFFTGVGFAYRF